MKKIILAALCLQVCAEGMTAQNEKKQELSVSVGPAITRIRNKNISNDRYKTVDDKTGYNFDLGYTRYISQAFGISVGLGYSSYSQLIYQKGLIESFSRTDKDGNIYDEWFDSDMTYKKKIATIDIPVFFHLVFGTSDNYGMFVDAGIINHYTASGIYSEEGSIENMGKYASSNPYFSIVSQNNSYYDYHVELYDHSYTDRFHRYNLSGHFAAGFTAKMSEQLFMKFQCYVNPGFTDVTAKPYRDLQYVNIVGLKDDYEKTKLFAGGLNVGFVFRIK